MSASQPRLDLTREQILSYRRRIAGLEERAVLSPTALRRAAWAGLQDSMPRAALLSLHARLSGVESDVLDHPSLVQVWGPRYSVFVVADRDRALFTLGRMPDDDRGRRRAIELADQLDSFLDGSEMQFGEAGHRLGMNPNRLRYATTTGRVLVRWDGARQPTVWTVPAPEMDGSAARLELARRHLHVFGPSTSRAFAKWAGLAGRSGDAAFEALAAEIVPVSTPIGDAWMLAGDIADVRSDADPSTATRLLPSGDTYYLLHGADRDLLVSDEVRRDTLWTSRVWPGAVLVDGEIVGIWKRSQHQVTVEPWGRLSRAARASIENEAASLPLPSLDRDITITWQD